MINEYTKLIKYQQEKLNCVLNAQSFTSAKEKSYEKIVNDILEKDQKYLEWLITQPWYKIKFKELCSQTIHLLNEKNKEPILIDENTTTIYTDGACSHNGSKKARMGIGVYFNKRNKINMDDISKSLFLDNPTNNRAELSAIKEALMVCKENNIKKMKIFKTLIDLPL